MTVKHTNPYDLVLVTWKDHVANDAWSGPHEVDNNPEMCYSVGWVYKEDDQGLSLVRDLDPVNYTGGDVGGIQYILKNCITEYKVLRKGKK